MNFRWTSMTALNLPGIGFALLFLMFLGTPPSQKLGGGTRKENTYLYPSMDSSNDGRGPAITSEVVVILRARAKTGIAEMWGTNARHFFPTRLNGRASFRGGRGRATAHKIGNVFPKQYLHPRGCHVERSEASRHMETRPFASPRVTE